MSKIPFILIGVIALLASRLVPSVPDKNGGRIILDSIMTVQQAREFCRARGGALERVFYASTSPVVTITCLPSR